MPTAALSRRELLDRASRRAAALALGSLFGAARGQGDAIAARRNAAVPSGAYPYTLGVASGMPRPDSVVLWTRLAPSPHVAGGGMPEASIEVTWELAEDERFARGRRSGRVRALREHAHSVHVEVGPLASATGYFYRFITGDAVSPVGRTRTAPAADAHVDRLRIALASCQHYEQGHYPAHREIADRDLDFVLFVGDYIYESSQPRLQVRRHEGPVPLTLDAYRARHATYKLDPDLQAAHAAHPWVLTWDDHEVENDYAGDRSPSGLVPAAFLQRRAAAYKAYFEHLPVSPGMAPQAAAMRIHDRYLWGDLAELWTLDNRQFRDPAACLPAGVASPESDCPALDSAARSRFGRAQEAWLADGLATSVRRWRLLGQGSQISPARVPAAGEGRLNLDGWDGYPAARRRLLEAIERAGSRTCCAWAATCTATSPRNCGGSPTTPARRSSRANLSALRCRAAAPRRRGWRRCSRPTPTSCTHALTSAATRCSRSGPGWRAASSAPRPRRPGMGRACRPRPATRSMRAGPVCVRTDALEIPACGVNWATRSVVFVASRGDGWRDTGRASRRCARSRHDHVRP